MENFFLAASEANKQKQEIARRAYMIWESERCPHGQHVRHWLEAEEDLIFELRFRDAIHIAAYYIWLAEGQQHGAHFRHWALAKEQIKQKLRQAAASLNLEPGDDFGKINLILFGILVAVIILLLLSKN